MASHPLHARHSDEPTAPAPAALGNSDDLFERLPAAALVIEFPTPRLTRYNLALRRLCACALGHEAAAWDGRLLAWLEKRGVLAQIATALALDCAFPRQVVECPCAGEGGPLWLAVEAAPLAMRETPEGLAREALVQISDWTEERRERLRAERALFSAQLYAEGLEAALEHLADGVTILDATGHIRAYNRAALAYARNRRAVERARARGMRLEPIWELRWPDGTTPREIERPELRAMLTGGGVVGVDALLVRERGGSLPVLVSAVPLRDESGGIAGVVTAYHDVTAIKEVERLKDEFISIASHELRQPLTVIQGQAQLLRRHLAREEAQGALPQRTRTALLGPVEAITAQTARVNGLVSELLDVSRIQAGQLKLEPAPTSLVELVRGVVEQQRAVSTRHTLEVRIALPQGTADLVAACDRRRVEQILMNLLSNAIKYSPEGGTIAIEIGMMAEASGSEHTVTGERRSVRAPAALITVRDCGIGIPPEALPRLFERFFRASNAAGIAGTGLGLYICRQLAWAHGGDLWAESAGDGVGAAFHIALPLATK